MTRKAFTDESEPCRADALITSPSWHHQLPRTALRSRDLSTNDKGLLHVLDYVGDGPVATASIPTLAGHLDISERQVRRGITKLGSFGYLRREQVGGYMWRTRLLQRRQRYAWTPGWAVRWFALHPGLTTAHLVLYLVVIDFAPQDKLDPTKGPWCELPLAQLARLVGVDSNLIPRMLRDLTEAGLLLLITGKGRVPIVSPCVEPETLEDRNERVECLLRILQDRDETTVGAEVQGVDSVIPMDNADLAPHIFMKSDGTPRSIASLSATGRSRRGLIATGGTK